MKILESNNYLHLWPLKQKTVTFERFECFFGKFTDLNEMTSYTNLFFTVRQTKQKCSV